MRIGTSLFNYSDFRIPTHPALWAALALAQRTMLTLPTHDSTVATDNATALRQILDDRSDLFISRNLRTTFQALAAAKTPGHVLGGRALVSLICDDDEVKTALLIWCNSTLGLRIRNCYAQTTQQGRATIQVGEIAKCPVLDFTEGGPASERARAVARDCVEGLSALHLQPISYAFQNKNRQWIDEVVLEMLGLNDDAVVTRAVATIRTMLCREPSAHGSSSAIMYALGLNY